MADLSDFKRSQIVGASTAGAKTKTTELFGVVRSTSKEKEQEFKFHQELFSLSI